MLLKESGNSGIVSGAGWFDRRRRSNFQVNAFFIFLNFFFIFCKNFFSQVLGLRRGKSIWFLQFDEMLEFIISVVGRVKEKKSNLNSMFDFWRNEGGKNHCSGIWTNSSGMSGIWQGHKEEEKKNRDDEFESLVANGREKKSYRRETITNLRSGNWQFVISGNSNYLWLEDLNLHFICDGELIRLNFVDAEDMLVDYRDAFGFHCHAPDRSLMVRKKKRGGKKEKKISKSN